MVKSADGTSVFRIHMLIWLCLEPGKAKKNKTLRYLFTAFICVASIFGFPAHLLLSKCESVSEMLQNIAISVPVAVCSFKTLCIWWKFDKVHKVNEIIRKLDRYIKEADEVEYYNGDLVPSAKRLMNVFAHLSVGSLIVMQLGVVVSGMHLTYKGYFPFDPYGSKFAFLVADFYQFIALCVDVYQALANDTYAPIALSMIAGHMRVLRMRVSKLGSDPKKSLSENSEELIECIKVHEDIMEFKRIVDDIISVYMMVQVVISGLNICLVFYIVTNNFHDIFLLSHYLLIWCAILFQVFPACYYGSLLEAECHQLTDSLFSCNWVDQSREFKKNFKIFMEQSLRKVTTEAGAGLIHLNLDSFVAVCRAAYSLFALVMQAK